jgi:hypothetical protein
MGSGSLQTIPFHLFLFVHALLEILYLKHRYNFLAVSLTGPGTMTVYHKTNLRMGGVSA